MSVSLSLLDLGAAGDYADDGDGKQEVGAASSSSSSSSSSAAIPSSSLLSLFVSLAGASPIPALSSFRAADGRRLTNDEWIYVFASIADFVGDVNRYNDSQWLSRITTVANALAPFSQQLKAMSCQSVQVRAALFQLAGVVPVFQYGETNKITTIADRI